VMLPFIKGSAPTEISPCDTSTADVTAAKADANAAADKQDKGRKNWFQRLFD
jgi:hypothetical protein